VSISCSPAAVLQAPGKPSCPPSTCSCGLGAAPESQATAQLLAKVLPSNRFCHGPTTAKLPPNWPDLQPSYRPATAQLPPSYRPAPPTRPQLLPDAPGVSCRPVATKDRRAARLEPGCLPVTAPNPSRRDPPVGSPILRTRSQMYASVRSCSRPRTSANVRERPLTSADIREHPRTSADTSRFQAAPQPQVASSYRPVSGQLQS